MASLPNYQESAVLFMQTLHLSICTITGTSEQISALFGTDSLHYKLLQAFHFSYYDSEIISTLNKAHIETDKFPQKGGRGTFFTHTQKIVHDIKYRPP
jgi:hypothetical protein